MARTVWILGAGFSKPLGGPLLNELLTTASQARVRAAFPVGDVGPYMKLVDTAALRVLDRYSKHGPHQREIRERHWDDAEAFLEALDAAANGEPDSPPATLIKNIFGPEAGAVIEELAGAARRLVAAECCAFLHKADPNSEKWGPYKRWAGLLGLGDSIVTFNYDRVIETARDAAGRSSEHVEVTLPGGAVRDGTVPVFKLHGSVDWQRQRDAFRQSERRDFAVVCPNDEMVIASPGPTKAALRKALDDVWNEALTRIEFADVLVFVGYRFPPSDSEARRRLFEAIVKNNTKNLTIRTVLGPDTTDKHTLRLKGILEYAMAANGRLQFGTADAIARQSRTYSLRVHPLGAEDFLDVYEPGHLHQGWVY